MYLVIHQSGEGSVGFHRAQDLGEAVQAVEQLRNENGVEEAKIYRLEEVAFEFRPYYRVELADFASEDAPSDWAPAAWSPEVAPELAEEVDPDADVAWADGSPAVAAEPAKATGTEHVMPAPIRRGLFGR